MSSCCSLLVLSQGRQPLFDGYSSFKLLFCVTLPALVILQLVAIAHVFKLDPYTEWPLLTRIRAYTFELQIEHPSAHYILLKQSLQCLCAVAGCGLMLLLLNLLSIGLYESVNDCCDPLIRTTATTTIISTQYQWIWVCIVCIALGFGNIHSIRLHQSQLAQKRLRSRVANLHASFSDNSKCAIVAWYCQMAVQRKVLWRRVLAAVMSVPVMMMASTPAILYVLASK